MALAPRGTGLRMDALSLRPEQTEDLGCLLAVAAEPVRHASVKFGDLARAKDEVMVAQNQAHATGEDVQPLVALVGRRLRDAFAGRDDDLPSLPPARLPGHW